MAMGKRAKGQSDHQSGGITAGTIYAENVAGGHNFIQHITNIFYKEKGEQLQQRYRKIMLNRVKEYWIKSLLEKSLNKEAMLKLDKQDVPDVIQHPWDMQVQELSNRESRFISRNKPIIEVFDEMGRSLLILGDPGAGKTITLLELARDSIIRAENDITEPIPVIFNLSSWNKRKGGLIDWLIEEFPIKYQVSTKICRQWLENNELFLMLDGLDELSAEKREPCIQSINEFREKYGLNDIVVCSRDKEYRNLTTRLNLQGAIIIQPLTTEQIKDYLNTFGEIFQELAKSPLMLNVMTLAYSEVPIEEVDRSGTIEERRNRLFDTYTNRMLTRRKKELRYPITQTIYYLQWLAKALYKHEQTEFFIEHMSPSWFTTKFQRLINGLGVLGVISAIIIPIDIVAMKHFWGEITLGRFFTWPFSNVSNMFVLLPIQFSALILVACLISIPLATPIVIDDIMKWSWKNFFNKLRITFISFIILGFILGDWRVNGMSLIFAVLLTGLQGSEKIEERVFPNQGIHRSIMYSSLFFFIFLLAGILIGIVLNTTPNGFLNGLIAGLLWGIVIGMIRGGISCIRHFVARFVFLISQNIPLNIKHFLDYATERIFLYKVGGGYIFIHRLLLEYFATKGN